MGAFSRAQKVCSYPGLSDGLGVNAKRQMTAPASKVIPTNPNKMSQTALSHGQEVTGFT